MGANRWDAEAYDTDFSFVSRYGDELLDLVGDVTGRRVLDLGCGTGRHAADLAARGAAVIGVDADADMLSRARREHPDVRFLQLDAYDLSLANLGEAEPFDACFSNAALHWMTDQARVLHNVRSILLEGGRFVAEMGGAGNIATLDGALRDALAAVGRPEIGVVANYFPTVDQQVALLEESGFRVDLVTWFRRPTPLAPGSTAADWTRHFRASTWAETPAELHGELGAQIDARAASLRTAEGWHADYCRLRFVAVAV